MLKNLKPMTPHQERVLQALHASDAWISHEAIDRISGASNGPEVIRMHADAHNALNMAVFYLRQPAANVPGARRKAIQALSALRSLSLSLED